MAVKFATSVTHYMPSIPTLSYLPDVPCSNRFYNLEHVPKSSSQSLSREQAPTLIPSVTSNVSQPPYVEQVKEPTASKPPLTLQHPSHQIQHQYRYQPTIIL